MRGILPAAAWALLLAAAAMGQSTPLPSFEVASVKPAAPCCAPGQWRESKAGDDRIDFRYVTLKYCIAFAYRIKEFQVSGPPWLGEAHYDIVAKGPEGTRHEQLPEMVQALMAERFKLELRRDKKEFNVLALLAGKSGPKLQPSADSDDSHGANIGMSMSSPNVGRVEVKHGDMTALANFLPRMVGRPVVDLTGITGRYDFAFDFSREDLSGMVLPDPNLARIPPTAELGTSLFNSIQQLGLKLEAQKLPLDNIVVVRGEKTPTEN